MENKISPKYLMNLISEIENELWEQFKSYKNVRFYIEKWYEYDDVVGGNFHIFEKEDENIDLLKTLHNMDNETIIKIAIDLGIETPGFIPSIPLFKNIMKESYPSAFDSFEKAIKQVIDNPDVAIGLANSTLESIIKEILQHLEINKDSINNKTLYELTNIILKEFHLYPNKDMPVEIRDIGSSLLKITKKIEEVRSNKTDFHGKTSFDYKITDPLYAYFIVNTITTIGLFLDNFYKIKFLQKNELENENDNLPF